MKKILLAGGAWLLAAAAWAAPIELMVQLRPGVTPAQTAAAPAVTAARPVVGGWWRVTLDTDTARSASLAAALRQDNRVQHVLERRREGLTRVPDDTLYTSEQWWLGNAASGSAGVPGLPAAWDRSTGAPVSSAQTPPVVAILDSGYTSHPELNDRWIGTGYDFVTDVRAANDGNGRDGDAADPGDRLTQAEKDADLAQWDGCEVRNASSWHGTLMAGQIGATSDNNRGVAGVHWDMGAKLLPVRVAGKCGAAVNDVVDGLLWAAGLPVAGVPANTHPARVIVLGVAGFEPCDTGSPDANVAAAAQLYIDTLAAVRAQGAVVIAAAGNQRGAVGRPASCPGAFGVTALNRQGFKAMYANYGPQVALATVGGDGPADRDCDDLLADTGLASTSNEGSNAPGQYGYAAGSGTSFAAPVVAGVAALMWTINPSLTVDQLEDGLQRSARPHVKVPILQACQSGGNIGRCQCVTGSCGAGILDADQALAFAASPSDYQAPTRNAITLDTPAIRACAQRLGLPVPPDDPASQPTGGGGGGGGGGALGLEWLVGLLGAVGALGGRGRRAEAHPD